MATKKKAKKKTAKKSSKKKLAKKPAKKSAKRAAPKAAKASAAPSRGKAVERFEYGENQEILRTSAKKFCSDNFTTDKLRQLAKTPKGIEDKTWEEIIGMGWTGLLIPEDLGGVGQSVYELGVLLEEMGFYLAPGPYLSSQLAVLVLLETASAAQKKQLFPGIAEGKCLPVLAPFEQFEEWNLCAGGTKAKKAGKGYEITGTKVNVTDAQSADLLLVTALTNKGPCLFAVDAKAKGVKITPDALIDETRRSATVELKKVKVEAGALLGGEGKAVTLISRALPKIWSAISAEMIGAARHVFQIGVEYAKIREQFGRPIGSFQGVKHRLVDRFVDEENARSIVYGALWAQDHDPERAVRLAHIAKAYLSDVGPRVADSVLRTHGGIGFTEECDVHLYWKRLRWGQMAFGDAVWHRPYVAAYVIGDGGAEDGQMTLSVM